MKLRVFALVLALSFVVWAQGTSAPSTPNSTPAPEAKSCCHPMDQMKEGEGCCHQAKGEGKVAMSCCGKEKCEMKEAKSCCEGKDMKACKKECKKDHKCCAGSSIDKNAANCCSHRQHKPAVS